MQPKILERWRLTTADVASVAGSFDRLIDVIRARYKPARSPITIEAKIRDWLYAELNNIERDRATRQSGGDA